MLRREFHRRGRWSTSWKLACLALCAPAWTPALAAGAPAPTRWTLEEALAVAFAQSPAVHVRQAELEEAAAGLVAAGTYPYNPELELRAARRSSPGGSTTDQGVSLTQEIEIAGQRRRRVAVAEGELAAAELTLKRRQRHLAFRVETAFAEALRERELLRVAQTDAALAQDTLEFSRRRLERGATSQIEVNLAQASAGRAERSVQQARASYAAARARLAEAAGQGPSTQPEPSGTLAAPQGDLPPLGEILERALRNRGDLAAARAQEQAAEATVRLAVADARPNLVVGAFVEREEASDDIVGATLGLSLPLFNRNQGRIAQSRAARQRLRYEGAALRLAVEGEVVAAFHDLQAAWSSAHYLRDQVLGTLEENVELLQKSFAAGRIGATEVVTLRREFVASRREYIEVLAQAWLARLRLDLAAGGLAAAGAGEGDPATRPPADGPRHIGEVLR